MMTAVTYTESRPSDVLASLHESAEAEREYLFASHDASDEDLILVAWYNGEAIGYIATSDQKDGGLLVWEHAVAPHFRGQGIGRQLLLEAAKRTKPTTAVVIDPMGALAVDRVVDYYSRLGFPVRPHDGHMTAMASDIVSSLEEPGEDETQVSDLLERKPPGVTTIAPDAPVTDAIQLMNKLGIGAVVASADGARVEGILSERDVLVGIDTHGSDYLTRQVRECITTDVVTVTSTDLVANAMAIMTTRRLRHLPVTTAGRLVGIISVGDLLLFRLRAIGGHIEPD